LKIFNHVSKIQNFSKRLVFLLPKNQQLELPITKRSSFATETVVERHIIMSAAKSFRLTDDGGRDPFDDEADDLGLSSSQIAVMSDVEWQNYMSKLASTTTVLPSTTSILYATTTPHPYRHVPTPHPKTGRTSLFTTPFSASQVSMETGAGGFRRPVRLQVVNPPQEVVFDINTNKTKTPMTTTSPSSTKKNLFESSRKCPSKTFMEPIPINFYARPDTPSVTQGFVKDSTTTPAAAPMEELNSTSSKKTTTLSFKTPAPAKKSTTIKKKKKQQHQHTSKKKSHCPPRRSPRFSQSKTALLSPMMIETNHHHHSPRMATRSSSSSSSSGSKKKDILLVVKKEQQEKNDEDEDNDKENSNEQ
jgi:hypothetical protein